MEQYYNAMACIKLSHKLANAMLLTIEQAV